MEKIHLGDAKDSLKQMMLAAVRPAIRAPLGLVPMFSERWTLRQRRSYREMLGVEHRPDLICGDRPSTRIRRERREPALQGHDLFLDPHMGLEPRSGVSSTHDHVRLAHASALLDLNPGRLLVCFQHPPSGWGRTRVHEWLPIHLEHIRQGVDGQALAWDGFSAGIIFVTREEVRATQIEDLLRTRYQSAADVCLIA